MYGLLLSIVTCITLHNINTHVENGRGGTCTYRSTLCNHQLLRLSQGCNIVVTMWLQPGYIQVYDLTLYMMYFTTVHVATNIVPYNDDR